MKKGFLSILSFAVCLFHSFSQAPKEKTLLWEISGKGIARPSYMFGTMHIMCPGDLQTPEIVKEKFNTTGELFLEMDMDDPNMMKEMLSGMQMKGSSTLEGLIGNRFDSASQLFQQTTGMPLKMLNTAKPFLLTSMIYPSLLGCTPGSWESIFQKMATDKGLEIKGLEKLQDQMDVFEKIPYKTQSEMLVQMLFNIDSSKKELLEMIDVYKTKDINQMNILTTKDENFGQYEGILLNDRNHNWIPVIGEQAKKQSTFFAFGAGHLGGENGVISLLRKAGFTVKPVFYQ